MTRPERDRGNQGQEGLGAACPPPPHGALADEASVDERVSLLFDVRVRPHTVCH